LYEIAFLLGMPVYQILNEMPQSELMGWGDYFTRKPYGWREDQRTAVILQALGYKGKPEDVFATLKQLKDGIPAEIKALPKGKFLEMMMGANGGDDSGWTPPWMNK
jgi:hypothetical protein